MEAAMVCPQVRSALVLAALSGEALKWAKKNQVTPSIPYQFLRQQLLAEFEPKAREFSEMAARFQLQDMRLTNMSDAQAFLARFDSLYRRSPAWDYQNTLQSRPSR